MGETRFRRSPRTISRSIGGSLLITSADRADYQELSSTGVAVWDLLDEPRSAKQIAVLLAPRYGRSPDEIVLDVEAVMRRLVESGHIERVILHHR